MVCETGRLLSRAPVRAAALGRKPGERTSRDEQQMGFRGALDCVPNRMNPMPADRGLGSRRHNIEPPSPCGGCHAVPGFLPVLFSRHRLPVEASWKLRKTPRWRCSGVSVALEGSGLVFYAPSNCLHGEMALSQILSACVMHSRPTPCSRRSAVHIAILFYLLYIRSSG